MSEKVERIDKVLVAQGYFESRAAAQAAIEAGRVKVAGRIISKSSEKVLQTVSIEAEAAHPYVSRGGMKLAHALNLFAVEAKGRTCLDIGASTGGFSEVLLLSGAARVIAVDVGRDQLHPRLKTEPRLVSLEGIDARDLSAQSIGGSPSLLVCDASFIALEKLLSVPLSLVEAGGEAILLFKPQFQVGRANIGKRGIVTDANATAQAELAFLNWLENQGWTVLGRADSPIMGGDGNSERLIHARKKQDNQLR